MESKSNHNENNVCHEKKCKSIARIVQASSLYSIQYDPKSFMDTYPRLLNDYHHLLQFHLNDINDTNDQYQRLHKKFSAVIRCKLADCKIYQTHYTKRSSNAKRQGDIKFNFYIDLLNNIHCYLTHLYDMGYAVNPQKMREINDTKMQQNSNEFEFVDEKRKVLAKYLSQIRSKNKLNNISNNYQRFTQVLEGQQSTAFSEDEIHSEYGYVEPYFKLGHRHYYVSNGLKYNDLKIEITQNDSCKLSMNQWNESVFQAKMVSESFKIKSMMSTETLHNIKVNETMSEQHVLSILLYCNYDDLCKKFREMFKKDNENIEYGQFARLLIEAVECFGDMVTHNNKFYCCLIPSINEDKQNKSYDLSKYYFKDFSLKFASPTSTTSQIGVVMVLAINDSDQINDNGIILELTKHITDYYGQLKYIDCRFFSSYSEENERLFFGGIYPLKIINITEINTSKTYALFISALSLLDRAITGQSTQINEIIFKNTYHMVDSLIVNIKEEKKLKLPSYICNIFNIFRKHKNRIIIDLKYFNIDAGRDSYHLLSKYFFSNQIQQGMVNIARMTEIFTKCKQINICTSAINDVIKMSSFYFTQLLFQLDELVASPLKAICFCNVQLDDGCDKKVLEQYQSLFRRSGYELLWNLIDKTVSITKMQRLIDSPEYQSIFIYAQNELSSLLKLKPIKEQQMKIIYKTKVHLKNEWKNCTSHEGCESLKRLEIILTTYKKLMESNKLWRNVSLLPILTLENVYTIEEISDDFSHVQDHIETNNEAQFLDDEIRKSLQKQFECSNLDKCNGYGRWRYRLNDKYPNSMTPEDIVFQQVCDKIHSYMVHFEFRDDEIRDLGFPRIESNEQPNAIKKGGKGYIGKKEDDNWWKECTIEEEKKNDDEIEKHTYHSLIKNMGVFRWQRCHGFSSTQHQALMHIKNRFANVKEEALFNIYYALSVDNWNQTLRKSQVFFKSFARQKIKTWYKGRYVDHITQTNSQWKTGTNIDMKEIVTLKLYTDFDKLQHELKKCFRFETMNDISTLNNFNPKYNNKERKHEPDRKAKISRFRLEKRLSSFYWWRIQLLTVLNKYGQELNKKVALFHGVNAKMILNHGTPKRLAFYGPLSTSASYHVARTFATAKGMVLQISTQYPRLGFCRAFNAALISDYPEEKEWLIGFVYLRVKTVLTRPLNKNWKTFDDIDNAEKKYPIPLSSQTRSVFFAIHLFRQQIFSMSVVLEYYLSSFLYLHCEYNEKHDNKDNGHIKKRKFIDKLERPNKTRDNSLKALLRKNKTNEDDEKYDYYREYKVLSILYQKFDNFRRYPNHEQVVKINEISSNLLPYFMDYSGLDIKKKEKYVISFAKIIRMFPNVVEIHFINTYLFDDVALEKLTDYLHKNPDSKLKRVKFLYYDYENKSEQKECYPLDNAIFCHPKELKEDLLNTLNDYKWKITSNNIGKIGYQIKVFSIYTKD